MKILIIEPFFSGSHRQWAEAYQKFSRHEVEILSLKGRHWKWRMFGGAVSLAENFKKTDFEPDLILATDMLDLATFLGLTRTRKVPVALYFHENQITYPWTGIEGTAAGELNRQYGFINYTSALAADKVFFNSAFHQRSFLEGLKPFLKAFPDHRGLKNIDRIVEKSAVLHLGMDLKALDSESTNREMKAPVLLWNHRWEYDKNPDLFFNTLFKLKENGTAFQLIVVGEAYRQVPPVFEEARERLREEIIHFGFAAGRSEYAALLHQADILPVTSQQDFFGGSIVEAIYCGCYPLLPERLAYPEHIPVDKKKNHFYRSDEDLLFMLENIIAQKHLFNEPGTYKNFVTQYDWSTLAPQYDEEMKNLLG